MPFFDFYISKRSFKKWDQAAWYLWCRTLYFARAPVSCRRSHLFTLLFCERSRKAKWSSLEKIIESNGAKEQIKRTTRRGKRVTKTKNKDTYVKNPYEKWWRWSGQLFQAMIECLLSYRSANIYSVMVHPKAIKSGGPQLTVHHESLRSGRSLRKFFFFGLDYGEVEVVKRVLRYWFRCSNEESNRLQYIAGLIYLIETSPGVKCTKIQNKTRQFPSYFTDSAGLAKAASLIKSRSIKVKITRLKIFWRFKFF